MNQNPLLLRFQHGYSTDRPVRPFLVLGPYVSIRMACTGDVVEAKLDNARSWTAFVSIEYLLRVL